MFHFKKNKITLDFEGKSFEVDAERAALWAKRSAESFGILDGIAGKDNPENVILSFLRGFSESLDALLGDGATGRIFGDRAINFYDCYDIAMYISEECRIFAASKRGGKK